MNILIIFILSVQSIYSFKLKDLIPIKYDVIKVRNESQLRDLAATEQYAVLDFIGLVERYGYVAEEHELTTRDGYRLMLHRITTTTRSTLPRPLVFLQHGATLSSDSYVLIGPGKDLAYLLADAGYDVWLGNARGNTYSRSHVTLSPKDKKFWEFSYHEIGLHDLSSSIDYVLKATNQTRLTYVGYSMGSAEILVLLSTKTKYNEKINLVVLLAPVVFWRYKSPLFTSIYINYRKLFENFINAAEYYEILPQNSFLGIVSREFCSNKSEDSKLSMCAKGFGLLSDLQIFNASAIPRILQHWPAGTSARSLEHYWQTVDDGEFHAYDRGPWSNRRFYGRTWPPIYNLARVTAPVAIIYAERDLFATPKNLEILRRRLPNVIAYKSVMHRNFNHFDFLWSTRAKELVYDDLMALLKNYTC